MLSELQVCNPPARDRVGAMVQDRLFDRESSSSGPEAHRVTAPRSRPLRDGGAENCSPFGPPFSNMNGSKSVVPLPASWQKSKANRIGGNPDHMPALVPFLRTSKMLSGHFSRRKTCSTVCNDVGVSRQYSWTSLIAIRERCTYGGTELLT